MSMFRPITVVILALSLLVSSGITSYGKALTAGGQTMLICSEIGVRTAIVGANGQELPPLHLCDECCIAIAAQALPVPGQYPAGMAIRTEFLALTPLQVKATIVPAQMARAPPIVG